MKISKKPPFTIIKKPSFKIVKKTENVSEKNTIEIKKTIQPNLPKPTWLHKESIMKILDIDGTQLQYCAQKTPANCGPLAIINWLYALSTFDHMFLYPHGFPRTSHGIRKLLSEDTLLRHTLWWPYGPDVSEDNHALVTDIIYNLIHRLTEIAPLRIVGDRMKSDHGIPPKEAFTVLDQSDRIIVHQNYHYKSYIKIDKYSWLCVDSMVTPYKISDENLKKNTDPSQLRFIGIKHITT